MLKRVVFVAGALGVVTFVFAAVVHFAFGRGAIQTANGVGRFGFEVARSGEQVRGRAQFAELVPTHPLPVVEIVMREARAANFVQNTVTFVGPGAIRRPGGLMNVLVEVFAVDNHGTKQPDVFRIRCFNPQTNMMVYQAGGALLSGDIVVGQRQQ